MNRAVKFKFVVFFQSDDSAQNCIDHMANTWTVFETADLGRLYHYWSFIGHHGLYFITYSPFIISFILCCKQSSSFSATVEKWYYILTSCEQISQVCVSSLSSLLDVMTASNHIYNMTNTRNVFKSTRLSSLYHDCSFICYHSHYTLSYIPYLSWVFSMTSELYSAFSVSVTSTVSKVMVCIFQSWYFLLGAPFVIQGTWSEKFIFTPEVLNFGLGGNRNQAICILQVQRGH